MAIQLSFSSRRIEGGSDELGLDSLAMSCRAVRPGMAVRILGMAEEGMCRTVAWDESYSSPVEGKLVAARRAVRDRPVHTFVGTLRVVNVSACARHVEPAHTLLAISSEVPASVAECGVDVVSARGDSRTGTRVVCLSGSVRPSASTT